ncbi:MAG: hypothetical protein E6J34_24315 [Chloroflexi bacterium]|nr:MAG: hypothetical protein E6J34_24315 [Chloroflexota bacterium]
MQAQRRVGLMDETPKQCGYEAITDPDPPIEGRRIWLITTYLTEFALVRGEDDAAVGHGTFLQTHLFEDRVMKMSAITIGASSCVGSRCVVFSDAEVGADASLDSLSLVMKGEKLPSGRGLTRHSCTSCLRNFAKEGENAGPITGLPFFPSFSPMILSD